MSLRFSLLGLIGLVTLSALASAALVKPSPGWLSVVVSLTAAAAAVQFLRAIVCAGPRRAAAVGWLVFAVGYLAIALGPWLGQHAGPQLASSKALAYAQEKWRKEDASAAATAQYEWLKSQQIWNRTLLGSTWSYVDVNDGAITISPASQVAAVNCFQLSGHWLFAWLAGWLGAVLAAHFQRRGSEAVG
jgi:hypothetical protein